MVVSLRPDSVVVPLMSGRGKRGDPEVVVLGELVGIQAASESSVWNGSLHDKSGPKPSCW